MQCLKGYDHWSFLGSRLFEANRFSITALKTAFADAIPTNELDCRSMKSKNQLCSELRRRRGLVNSSTVKKILLKATSIQFQNGISAICLGWDNNEDQNSLVPPILLRSDGSLSALIEVQGLQHMENVLSLIQTKKFLRDNLLLYLSLREPGLKSSRDKSKDLHSRIKENEEDLIERVRYIEKNHHLFGENFESGISDYFLLKNDKIVEPSDLGTKVHSNAP
jgi:hypothetical protein